MARRLAAEMKFSALILACGLLAACAADVAVPARLYDLASGRVIEATLGSFQQGYGRMTAQMPNGELLEGEYTLYVQRPGSPVAPSASTSSNVDRPQSEGNTEGPPEGRKPSEVYGFGEGVEADPIGSATLVGNRGTVLQVVFYRMNALARYGDGVAYDNKGNWYRIHVGMIAPAGG